jgi:hypothetical protein
MFTVATFGLFAFLLPSEASAQEYQEVIACHESSKSDTKSFEAWFCMKGKELTKDECAFRYDEDKGLDSTDCWTLADPDELFLGDLGLGDTCWLGETIQFDDDEWRPTPVPSDTDDEPPSDDDDTEDEPEPTPTPAPTPTPTPTPTPPPEDLACFYLDAFSVLRR